MGNKQTQVKVKAKKKGSNKKVHLSSSPVGLNFKIDGNGKRRKKGW